MIDAIVLGVDQLDDGLRQVGGVGRVTDLVDDNAQAAMLVGSGDDLGGKVGPPGCVEPGSADDVESAQVQPRVEFGGQLGAGVGVDGVGGFVFVIGRAFGTVEYLVGAFPRPLP